MGDHVFEETTGLFSVPVPGGWQADETDHGVTLIDPIGMSRLTLSVYSPDSPATRPVEALEEVARQLGDREVLQAPEPLAAHADADAEPESLPTKRFVCVYRGTLTGAPDRCTVAAASVANTERVLLLVLATEQSPDSDLVARYFPSAVAAATLSGRPSFARFVEQTMHVIRTKFPLVRVSYDADSGTLMFNDSQCGLESLYRQVCLHPDRLELLVARRFTEFLRQQERGHPSEQEFDAIRDRIMPMLLHTTQAQQFANIVTRPFVNHVRVAYVIDEDNSFWYIAEPMLARWNADAEEIHQLALANLRRYATTLEVLASQAEGFRLIVINRNDGYDASRLLLEDLHSRMRDYLGSPFYAAVPNRDLLLAFSHSDDAVEQLRPRLQRDVRQQPYPITAELFLVTNDGIAGEASDDDDLALGSEAQT